MDNNMGFDKDKNFMNNHEHNVITLERWLEEEHTTEEKEAIVLKIDSSLRVYHEYSCNIESFDPKDITTDLDEDDDDDNSVYFLVYSKDEDTSEYVAKNIHDAGILAFSIYMDRDLRGHEDFLKMNFDEFLIYYQSLTIILILHKPYSSTWFQHRSINLQLLKSSTDGI